jgi:hypothetical protein
MATLDENTVPRSLFRYVPFQNNFDSLRRVLESNQWYFGSCANFDDGDDSRLPGVRLDRDHLRGMMARSDGRLTEREIEQFLRDPDAARRVTADVQNYINGVGILCLSEVGNDPALWRDYGDNGRGVCLWLETLKIANDDHYRDRGPFEIIYSDAPRRPWNPRSDDQMAQTEAHLLQKATRWQYQKEWRFLMHDDANSTVGYHSMPVDALRGVILGCRLTARERQDIRKWIIGGPFRPSIIFSVALQNEKSVG